MTTSYDGAVQSIKRAILEQQLHAARRINAVQLALYYSVGHYISVNSRVGQWGKGAIEYISKKLQEQLPGLRGFSATNIKQMRLFYEAWSANVRAPMGESIAEDRTHIKSSVTTDDLGIAPEIGSFLSLPQLTEVAVYKTQDEMPEKLRRALPCMEDLRKFL